MRTRRRIGLLLASAAALGVGLIAFPASAAAAPPPVPTCVFPVTAGSDSCGKLVTTGSPNPIGTAYENIKLGVRVRSKFDPSSSETTSVNLKFDQDIKFNLAGCPGDVPLRDAERQDHRRRPMRYAAPARGGSNTYLSAAGNVSGVASTTVAGIDACTMIFKGATNNQVLIYARAPIGNPSTECNSPSTNTAGSTTIVFTGTLSHQPAASPYDWTLNVPNTHTAAVPLDDFGATITRGTALQARCLARGVNPPHARDVGLHRWR